MLEKLKKTMYINRRFDSLENVNDVIFKFGYKFNAAYESEEHAKEELLKRIKYEVYHDVETKLIQVVINLIMKNGRNSDITSEINALQDLLEEIA